METSVWSTISFMVIVYVAATVFSTALLVLLSYLKVIRTKRRGDVLIWGIAGGILITFLYVTLMCNY